MYNEREYWSNRIKLHGSVNTTTFDKDSVNEKEAALLLKYISKGNVILDYGVGSGRLFPIYNEIKPIVQGWDIADFTELLKQQYEKHKDFQYYHCYSDSKEIWQMDYPANNFKVCVSFSVFTHIKPENIQNTITELMRISDLLICSAYDDAPLATHEDNYCFLHDYKKLFKNYRIIEQFKINKISYFVIEE